MIYQLGLYSGFKLHGYGRLRGYFFGRLKDRSNTVYGRLKWRIYRLIIQNRYEIHHFGRK